MMMGGLAVATHHHDCFEIFAGIIFTFILSLLPISSYGTLLLRRRGGKKCKKNNK